MFKNYLKTAFRNLIKNKFYSSLNIVGLAVGLATCLLIFLYVYDEMSYDRYNKKAGRIYRINNEVKFGGNHFNLACAPALMGITCLHDIPAVEQYTRLMWHGSWSVKKGIEDVRESRIAYADSTLFDVFTLPLIAGNPKTALTLPRSVVITESIARKYFDRTDVVGSSLRINDTSNYKITAVIKDIPLTSHFNYNFFVPFVEDPNSTSNNWVSENYNTYVVVKEGTDIKKLELQMTDLLERNTEPMLKDLLHQDMAELKKQGTILKADLTPLLDIHLHSNKIGELDGNGNAQIVYIFFAIAVLILVIACVNFMNLSTARSANRAKEVGVRKVLGSLRKSLIRQFLMESTLISFIAMIIAIVLAALLLPYFNMLSGKRIESGLLFHPVMIVSLLLLMLIVGLLAGSYPAFVLSAFRPIEVLKGKFARGFKGSLLRNSLVVFQFFISITLVVGTLVIYRQLNYMRNKDIGYNRHQVMVIENTDVLKAGSETFKNELLKISGVQNATMSGFLPVNYNRNNDAFFPSPTLDAKTAMSMQSWTVDENYIPTLDLKLLQGRNFSPQMLTDSSALIVNEAAAKFLNTKDLLNLALYEIDDPSTKKLKTLHIIGVIRNFNFSSFHDAITPLALKFSKDNGSISCRINTSDIQGVVAKCKNLWTTMVPGKPFNYSFMDDRFNNMYMSESKTGQIFISFATLAIFIACLGLFGLVTFAANQRTKEIGIRKIVGANVTNIVTMIAADFLKLVLIASIVAFPVAWWGMHKWLQDFAYRVDIEWWIFVLAGVLILLIALITICIQAIKAALANPVKSLRTE